MQISYTNWKWLLIGAGLALLLCMLAYPFGYDQSVFMIGGEMTVKNGAIPYRDFLDTKPPIIFFIYGISSLIFGHHEWSIRAFDILFQIGSLFYFFKLFKRTTGDEKLAVASVFLYALFYVTSGYWMTAQAETFALLPSLIAFDLTDRIIHQKQLHFILGIYAGLACAVLFLLKFTLLTIPIGIVLYLLLQVKNGWRFPWKYIFGLTSAFVLIVGAYVLYLIGTDSWVRFAESLQWVKQYADADPLFSSHTIIERFFKLFPMLAIYPFGLSGILIAIIGIVWWSKDNLRPLPSEKKDSSLLHLFLQLSLALIAVLYERKFFVYHFSRCYWAFVPFVALGLRELWRIWKDYSLEWMRMKTGERLLRYVLGGIVAAVIFFFSIVPRIVSQPLHFVLMRVTGADLAKDVEEQMPQYYYKEEQKVADYLRPLMKSEDKLFVWGNSVGIYYFLERYPTTIVLTDTPLITSWTPLSWKNTMLYQLSTAPPRFFIAESGDEREYITGNASDSHVQFENWNELHQFVEADYMIRKEFPHFSIYERIIHVQ